MLRSTHRADQPPLPEGWTEHKAPTGHTYYYNASENRSTYERPIQPIPAPSIEPQPVIAQNNWTNGYAPTQPYGTSNAFHASQPEAWNGRGGKDYQSQRRRQDHDRPKHKYALPDCAPWVLIKTKLGRRFVHNTETKESLWRYPPDVLKAVVEFDRVEREKRERRERGEFEEDTREPPLDETSKPQDAQTSSLGQADEELGSDEEYEEVEVTDEEEDYDQGQPSKKPKFEEAFEGPVEFDEDDIAYQLRVMGEGYGLDPAEYGNPYNEELEEGAEGLALTDEDSRALFRDMLDDYNINPYTPWDAILEEGRILEDDRYTVYTNMKARQEAWKEWSKDKIQSIKELRAQQVATDPRIPYLELLHRHASTKLYWPEFKRKYRKETEMKDTKLSDKDREKLYREHIKRLKLPSSTQKSDLTALLKSVPLAQLHRSTQMTALPPTVGSDLRYISLPSSIRDPLIETWIKNLPTAPDASKGTSEETEEESAKRLERQRREKALAERERKVQDEKRRQEKELRYGKGVLREEERELERANAVGRRGLKAQLEDAAEH